MDVITFVGGYTGFYITDGTNSKYLYFTDLHVVNGSHIKVEYNGSVFTIVIDDNLSYYSKTLDVHRISLQLSSGSSNILKYKNFILYES